MDGTGGKGERLLIRTDGNIGECLFVYNVKGMGAVHTAGRWAHLGSGNGRVWCRESTVGDMKMGCWVWMLYV